MTLVPATTLPPITRTESGDLRVGNMLTRREFEAIERLRASEWFLVRNDGGEIGERGPCRWHIADPMKGTRNALIEKPVFHDYFTLMCIERPFSGLERGLRAWIQVAGDSVRKQVIEDNFGIGLRDYAEAHPQTGQLLKPASSDALAFYSVIVGFVEPIKEDRARKLAQLIRDRRPPQFPPEFRPLLLPKGTPRLNLLGGIPRGV